MTESHTANMALRLKVDADRAGRWILQILYLVARWFESNLLYVTKLDKVLEGLIT